MQHSTDIVVHINESLDKRDREVFSHKIKKIAGVISVSTQDQRPHLIVIAYNDNKTKAQDVISNIRKTGSQAQLVGWL
jgi:Na+-translocating ferredoxin:NAD+ oxidoreductase RnfC subunit